MLESLVIIEEKVKFKIKWVKIDDLDVYMMIKYEDNI